MYNLKFDGKRLDRNAKIFFHLIFYSFLQYSLLHHPTLLTLCLKCFVTAFAFINFFKKESFDKEQRMNYLSFILHSVSWVSLYSNLILRRMQVKYMLLRFCVLCVCICLLTPVRAHVRICVSVCVYSQGKPGEAFSLPPPFQLKAETGIRQTVGIHTGIQITSSNHKCVKEKKKIGIT